MTDAGATTDEFLPGAVLAGQFRIVRRIGQGGMGSVYLAVQIPMSREVVIKVLRDDRSALSTVAIERFRREAATIAQLDHPNIVHVYYFGETQLGRYFLAMEYVLGITLADLLDAEKKLEWRRALTIARQIAGALGEAHHRGIIHRDLKPENVMLTNRRGQSDLVKLLDFGIARNVFSNITDPGRLTRAGEVFGTPRYISPEQARGLVVDHRSDLYAWGVVLYESLCGRLPFQSSTPMGYLVAHMTEIPVPPSRHVTDVTIPPSVETLLLKCLEKNPDERFPDAETLIAAIDAVLRNSENTHPASAESKPIESGTKPSMSWRTKAVILFGSAAIFAVVFWLAWSSSVDSELPNTLDAQSLVRTPVTVSPPNSLFIANEADMGIVEVPGTDSGQVVDPDEIPDDGDVAVLEEDDWDDDEAPATVDPKVPIPNAGQDIDGLPVVYDAILQASTPSTVSYLTKVPPQQIANFYLHRFADSMGPIRRIPSGLYFERDGSPLASITVVAYGSRWMVVLMRNAMAEHYEIPQLPDSLFGVPIYPGSIATARTPQSVILSVSKSPKVVIPFYRNAFESMPDIVIQDVDDGTGPKFLALGHAADVDFQVVTIMADPMLPGGEDTMIVIAAKQ
ncbi:MAG: serine/threonine protein kinase [Myxococcales bacterium]|nr:serine/threonine protein kinase [Myxococcales bacterium]